MIWDVKSGRALRVIQDVVAAAIAPSGKKVMTGSNRGILKLWTIGKAEPDWVDDSMVGKIGWLAFSPDGAAFWACADPGDLSLRTANGRTARWTMNDGCMDDRFGWRPAVTPRGVVLPQHDGDSNGLAVVDLRTGRPTRFFQATPGTGPITTAAASADAKTIVAGTYFFQRVRGEPTGGQIVVWTREGHQRATLEGHKVEVRQVAVSPSGEMAVSVSRDSLVRIWDLRRGHEAEMRSSM